MFFRIKSIVEHKYFEIFVTSLIVVNAITLGLETFKTLNPKLLSIVYTLDKAFLCFFVLELVARIYVHRRKFFLDPWGVFDFVIVSIALIPATGSLSALRAFRVLRTLRVISTVPTLRRVVSGLLSAIPGLSAVGSILLVIFYVGAVVSTKLFGEQFPQWFGSIQSSAYSLFQIMTLESWSMGIVRPVMGAFPAAWLFFIPFILVTTFTMLNLFIAVIVNAMQAETDAAADQRAQKGEDERAKLLVELGELRKEVTSLHKALLERSSTEAKNPKKGITSSPQFEPL